MFETPPELPLYANRFTSFYDYISFKGVDWTGATCKMQVRTAYNSGDLEFDLANVTSAIEGVQLVITEEDSVFYSTINIRINDVSSAYLDYDTSKDVNLVYDIKVTLTTGEEFIASRGDFVIRAGSTQ